MQPGSGGGNGSGGVGENSLVAGSVSGVVAGGAADVWGQGGFPESIEGGKEIFCAFKF